MLDQNTDRMWFVIGAVIVGAAIIFIANGTLPEIFASVSDTFYGSTEDATSVIRDIVYDGPINMSVRAGQENHDGSVDIKVFADGMSGIAKVEMVDGPEAVTGQKVLSFDGKDDYLDMMYDFGPATSFSISTIMNDVGNNDFLVNHDTGGGWSTVSNGGIKSDTKTGKWKGATSEGATSENTTLARSNRTHHVILTWDGTTVRRYVDGQKVMEESNTEGSYHLRTYYIGSRANNMSSEVREPNGWSSGQVLDFGLFKNRVLTEAEVANIFDNGLNNSESNLVLRYDFSEGEGNTIYDKSGNGRHATLHGASWQSMFNVSKKGEYTFKVTDTEGNVREESVTVR